MAPPAPATRPHQPRVVAILRTFSDGRTLGHLAAQRIDIHARTLEDLGDRVTVRLLRADVEQGFIDFARARR